MSATLDTNPVMMIEITNNNEQVYSLLKKRGYRLFKDTDVELIDGEIFLGNTFCYPEKDVSRYV